MVLDFTETRVDQEAVAEGREDGWKQGWKEGWKEAWDQAWNTGRNEGCKRTIQEVARRMLGLGRPIAEIVQVTGWTAAQIRKLGKKPRK